jgi:S-adenosylmethionine:tRNA ribosyltransferase-isomerase
VSSSPTPNSNPDLLLESYDYTLPPDRIAQNPVVPRDSSKLLVIREAPQYAHHHFRDLADLLRPHDLLVMNNTRVIPARLYGHKLRSDRTEGQSTEGAKIEVLLLEELQPQQWLALVRPGKRIKLGNRIEFGSESLRLQAEVVGIDAPTGGRVLQFETPDHQPLLSVLPMLGEVPLPPYIQDSQADPEQYQTVYGDRPGSAAAPTAGLHFTPELLTRLQDKGIQQTFVTLHVGVGTFRPVEASDITQHQMHGEWLEVSQETVDKIQQTKAQGGRIIAVGTTSVRALEGAAKASDAYQVDQLRPYCGKTELYIYPGYQWRMVEGLITNFHLPKSSLMMLVSALIGRERLLEMYRVAIADQYRFYSFGDAMLILPEAQINLSPS